MTENDTRKEIIRVFRKYERLGLSREGLDPVRAYKRIEVLCFSRRGKLDMFAVYDTMRILHLMGEEDVIRAVREVYFTDASKKRVSFMRVLEKILKNFRSKKWINLRNMLKFAKVEKSRISGA